VTPFRNPQKDVAFLENIVSGVGEVVWDRKKKGQCFPTVAKKRSLLNAISHAVHGCWKIENAIAEAANLKREHPGIAVGILMVVHSADSTKRDGIPRSIAGRLNQLLDELHVTSFRFETEGVVKVTFNSFPDFREILRG